jgi:hypothetical protein
MNKHEEKRKRLNKKRVTQHLEKRKRMAKPVVGQVVIQQFNDGTVEWDFGPNLALAAGLLQFAQEGLKRQVFPPVQVQQAPVTTTSENTQSLENSDCNEPVEVPSLRNGSRFSSSKKE